MSMLAEPRRKQKISIDPQNKTWERDEEKFGKKMMEKMGWKQGRGLGVNQQGIAEPVKLKANSEEKGLGYKRKYDDTWMEHQNEFGSLLASLQQGDGDATPAEAPTTSAGKGFSLEKHSKSSRNRVQ